MKFKKYIIALLITCPPTSSATNAQITINNLESYTIFRSHSGTQWFAAFKSELKRGTLASLRDCLDATLNKTASYSVSEHNQKTWISYAFPITQTDYWEILNKRSPKTLTLCTHKSDTEDSMEINVVIKDSPDPTLHERIVELLPRNAEKSLTAVDCLAPSKGRAKCKANPYGCLNDCPDLSVEFKDESGKALIRYLDGRADSYLTENLSRYPVSVIFNSSITPSWDRRVIDAAEIIKSTLCLVAPRVKPLEGGFCVSKSIKSPSDGVSASLFVVDNDSVNTAFNIGKEWVVPESTRVNPFLRGVAISAGVNTDFSKDKNSASSFYYRKIDWNSPIPECTNVESSLLFAIAPREGCGKTTPVPLGPSGHPVIIPAVDQATNATLCNLGQSMVWTTDWSTSVLTPTEEMRPALQELSRPVVGLFRGNNSNNDTTYVVIACRGDFCQHKGSDNWSSNSTILSQAVIPTSTTDLSPWGKQLEFLSSRVGFTSVTFSPELCRTTPFRLVH